MCDEFQPEIYSLLLDESLQDHESDDFFISSGVQNSNLQEKWSAAVAEACRIASLNGEDQRPHLWDTGMQQHLLVDSGSAVTAWPPDPGDVPDPSRSLRAVNGSRLKCYGKKEIVVKLGRKQLKFEAIKADVSSPILGWDFIRAHKLSFVWNKWGDILVKHKKSGIKKLLEFKPIPQVQSENLSALRLTEASANQPEAINYAQLIQEVAAMEAVDTPADTNEPDIFMEEQSMDLLPDSDFKTLLARFPGLLKQDFTKDSSKTGVIHRIDTGQAPPTRAKTRPLPPNCPKAKEGYKAWKELERLGIIEKVKPGEPNNWTNPLHFVWKPDKTVRPVGDYRQLNIRTILDLYPLKHIKSFTQDMAGSVIFSKVDLFKAFHQIVIDPRDRHKTCVTTPWGLYNYRRLAMGLQNSAQSFQRVVDCVLDGLENVYAYLDDILVFSRSKADHMATLEKLFKRLDDAGLTLNLKKCEFGKEDISFLGYQVNKNGIRPMEKKVEAVANFKRPQKQKELLAFLGSLNYYRASLPSLKQGEVTRTPAEILGPLYKLATCKITKQASFSKIWEDTPLIQEAFDDAKAMLVKAVNLTFPDPAAPLSLTTDASKYAVGAQLDQFVDGHWRPLGLWSKGLNPAQQLYTT